MTHWPGVILASWVFLAGSVLPAATAKAADPPCAPGEALIPTIQVKDVTDSRFIRGGDRDPPVLDPVLTATHDIEVTALFPSSNKPETARVAGPSGVPVIQSNSDGETTFRPSAAGPLPLSLTWTQLSNDRTCTGSMSATVQIAAAKALRVNRPRRLDPGRGLLPSPTGGRVLWALPSGKDTDANPLEIRFRGRRGLRLPKASAPFKTQTRGFGRLRERDIGPRTLRAPLLTVDEDGGLQVHTSPYYKNVRVGYELQILQSGKRLGRLRVIADCETLFSSCKYRVFRFDR